MKARDFTLAQHDTTPGLALGNDSRVAVVGGGPAGSFFSYFLLDTAARMEINVRVDVYDPKDFGRAGPVGCNHCGGIISESLVQILAAEGIRIPATVIQRGLDSYILHTEAGSVRIDTPIHEKRIGAIHRGAGPLGSSGMEGSSFDGYLRDLTIQKGVNMVKDQVKGLALDGDRPTVTTKGGQSQTYDLVVGACGLNPAALKLFEGLDFGYEAPQMAKTAICEFLLGRELIRQHFGNSMHTFLLNIPHLEFAALIPKGDYVTMVMLADKVDREFVLRFLQAPEVKQCFPPDWDFSQRTPCQCFPPIYISNAKKPFGNRVVLVGDSGVSKLYKDGIGAAYTTGKAAAVTAILHGVSESAFQEHYWPVCQKLINDNRVGKVIFTFTGVIRRSKILKRGVLNMVAKEQRKPGPCRHMSTVLWDTFTGSAPYREIFLRMLKPAYMANLARETAAAILPSSHKVQLAENAMQTTELGKVYHDGEAIIEEGADGNCFYVIQSGRVEVVQGKAGSEVRLAELKEGEFFGEMALFQSMKRSSTVRALGDVRVITVDKRTLMRTIQTNPALAFSLLEKLCSRVREMSARTQELEAKLAMSQHKQ
ncbi:MAG: cyclic nucleotide-binding domain-containing protein [Verrucomicrobia bacterium]|nr:cyclic nucleotide-binding domain-containing protein [Verrucomicrobiota bacterium]